MAERTAPETLQEQCRVTLAPVQVDADFLHKNFIADYDVYAN